MKRFLSVSLGLLVTLCLIVGTERRAWGYVDPGSGLIALQTIASVVAAYAYMVRRRIRAWFTRKEKKSDGLPVTAKTADPSETA
jgi:hypothetical protein